MNTRNAKSALIDRLYDAANAILDDAARDGYVAVSHRQALAYADSLRSYAERVRAQSWGMSEGVASWVARMPQCV